MKSRSVSSEIAQLTTCLSLLNLHLLNISCLTLYRKCSNSILVLPLISAHKCYRNWNAFGAVVRANCGLSLAKSVLILRAKIDNFYLIIAYFSKANRSLKYLFPKRLLKNELRSFFDDVKFAWRLIECQKCLRSISRFSREFLLFCMSTLQPSIDEWKWSQNTL